MKRCLILMVAFFLYNCSKTIEVPPNKAGIIINNDGHVDTTRVLFFEKYTLNEGEEIIFMDTSVQSIEFTIDVLNTESKSLSLEIYFEPKVNLMSILYKNYGEDYARKTIIPATQKAIDKLLTGDEKIDKELLEAKISNELNINNDFILTKKVFIN